MKIGIYDPYLDDVGGGEKYVMTLAECLSKSHEVSVFWDNEADFDAIRERFSLDLEKVSLRPNIFASTVGFFQRARETQKYDVLIVVSDGSVPFVFSKKLFLHIQQPLETVAITSLKGRLKLARVTGIFYNSQFTKHFNEKRLPAARSTVIYPPVAIHEKDVKKEQMILHVGRFRTLDVLTGVKDFKKQTVIIDVFKNMVDNRMISDWRLAMAVSVQEKDKEKFETLKNSAKGYPVEFLINKTNDELWDLYNKAKIYWHASGYGEDLNAHPEYAEHFGISTVEAMGAGAVPVVINAGGQKEIVTEGENGLLWDTLEELQDKTKKLMTDHKLWKELSDAARMRAKDFGKDKFEQAVLELIRK